MPHRASPIARPVAVGVVVASVFLGMPGCNKDDLGGIPGDLRGRICDEQSGLPLANVAVHMEGTVTRDGVTTADGRYLFSRVPVGTYTVTATDPSTADTRSVEAVVNPNDTAFTNEDTACRVPPGEAGKGKLVGQVCNRHTGDFVANAQVILVLPDGNTLTDTTDSLGNFEVDDVPAGPQVVHIQGGGFQRAFGVEIHADQTTTLDLADDCNTVDLSEGGVGGSFCDPTQTDIDAGDDLRNGLLVGATVSVSPAVDGVTFTDVTDTSGSFEINGLPPGSYTLHVHRDASAVGAAFDQSNIAVTISAGAVANLGQVNAGACGVPEGQCVTFTAEPSSTADGRILLVVDRSGSMGLADDGGQEKWTSMASALENVTRSLDDRVEFGLMLFPGDAAGGSNPSTAEQCSTGSSVLGIAPNNANAIASRLDGVTPAGGTPTAATLAGAKAQVQQTLASDTSPRPLAVLLATDGGPNCNLTGSLNASTCTCTSVNSDGSCSLANCLDDGNTLAQIDAIGQLGVKTFVIGVTGVDAFSNVMSAMADHGGTAQPGLFQFFPANNEAQLESALDAITSQVLACHIEDPNADFLAAESVDVNLGTDAINRDTLRQNGWDITSAHTIDLFGQACNTASAVGAPPLRVEICN